MVLSGTKRIPTDGRTHVKSRLNKISKTYEQPFIYKRKQMFDKNPYILTLFHAYHIKTYEQPFIYKRKQMFDIKKHLTST